MQSPDDVAATIRGFFAARGGASLELPTGWFGRPYDNFHALRGVDVVADGLVIGIDELQTLTLRGGAEATVDGRTLTLTGFARADWDWTAYGSVPARRQHQDVPSGPIRFHG